MQLQSRRECLLLLFVVLLSAPHVGELMVYNELFLHLFPLRTQHYVILAGPDLKKYRKAVKHLMDLRDDVFFVMVAEAGVLIETGLLLYKHLLLSAGLEVFEC